MTNDVKRIKHYSQKNISSIVQESAVHSLEIVDVLVSVVRPDSKPLIIARETPEISANFVCVIPLFSRISLSITFIETLLCV